MSTNPSNPAEVVGASALAGKEHADAALEAAWKAFESCALKNGAKKQKKVKQKTRSGLAITHMLHCKT